MAELKRYTRLVLLGADPDCKMMRCADGEWASYDEAAEELAERDARIAELEDSLREAKAQRDEARRTLCQFAYAPKIPSPRQLRKEAEFRWGADVAANLFPETRDG